MEKETKHTPGEWHSVTQSNEVILIKSGTIEVARINPHFEESQANAELIASAPALLEENERLSKRLSFLGGEDAIKNALALRAEVDRLTESLDEWHKKANKEQDDAYKWYTKYNEMSERAFSSSNREHHLVSEVDRLTKEKSELINAIESVSHLFYDVRNSQLIQDLDSLLTRIK